MNAHPKSKAHISDSLVANVHYKAQSSHFELKIIFHLKFICSTQRMSNEHFTTHHVKAKHGRDMLRVYRWIYKVQYANYFCFYFLTSHRECMEIAFAPAIYHVSHYKTCRKI